ncbi:hypothetical protein [Nannocystis pusilla]|uniref:hypothetical protein n=1 Tax=Nannocystis pusilla TaxID=889268 RepID=UPI003B817A64
MPMLVPDFADVEALKNRLTVTNPERPFVFLVGAPLTGSGDSGVADVSGMQELVRGASRGGRSAG